MHPRIVRKLGMEGRRHDGSLPHGDGIIAFGGEDFNAGPNALDLGCADKHHLGRLAEKLSFTNRTFELPAVAVPPDSDIKRSQPRLLRILHFVRQQDRPGARSERWLHPHELFQFFETGLAEQFEKCARLAARNDESVDLIELLGLADENDPGPELFKPFAVRVKIALQS